MDIIWHGLSCFTIKGKAGTVFLDPYSAAEVGLKPVKYSADIVLANLDFARHHEVSQFTKGDVKVFDWPGEYESKGIHMHGIPAYDRPREKDDSKKDESNKVIVFRIDIDGFKICHLSNIGHKLTPEMLEVIGDIDILIVPVGGHGCLDPKKAHEVIEQVDPRIVIPMYYKIPGIKLPLVELPVFLKEVGIASPVTEKVLKFPSPSVLPQENTEYKILEPDLG